LESLSVFALLQLKNITWALLLIMNTSLFGYLMKLAVDSGVSAGKTVIGSDGAIIKHANSDDSSIIESSAVQSNKNNAATYMLPTLLKTSCAFHYVVDDPPERSCYNTMTTTLSSEYYHARVIEYYRILMIVILVFVHPILLDHHVRMSQPLCPTPSLYLVLELDVLKPDVLLVRVTID
jgi:hypothetical protein